MKPTLLILAAGIGSRYGGLKQLDALGPNNETIMDYSIRDALEAGFGKVVLVIRKEFQKDFDEKIASRWKNKIKIEFAYQEVNPTFDGLKIVAREKPWGPLHAVLSAKEKINEPFAVINADDFYGKDSFVQMKKFLLERSKSDHYAMTGYILKNTLSEHGSVSRGICETGKNGFLKGVKEFKEIKKQGNNIYGIFEGGSELLKSDSVVSMNFWGFHLSFFDFGEKIFMEFVRQNQNNTKGEMVIPDVISPLLQESKVKVSILPCSEKWFGVTHLEDKERVKELLRKKEKDQPEI